MTGDDTALPNNVRLRPAGETDWPQLTRWLRDPAVQKWWGHAADAEAAIRLILETPSAMGRIIEVGDRPVGYTHAIEATFWGETLPDDLPDWTWDVDLFIAEAEYRGKGVGKQALELLADEVFGSTFAMALSVFVPVKNEAAVRSYEQAGFKWVSVWDDPIAGPVWLMLRQRPKK